MTVQAIFKPRYYLPFTLPRVPRSRCGFVGHKIKTLKDDQYKPYDAIVRGSCERTPLGHGWCRDHEYAVKFLELASFTGCPALVVSTIEYGRSHSYILIGNSTLHGKVMPRAGLATYEEMATRMSPERTFLACRLLLKEVGNLHLQEPYPGFCASLVSWAQDISKSPYVGQI